MPGFPLSINGILLYVPFCMQPPLFYNRSGRLIHSFVQLCRWCAASDCIKRDTICVSIHPGNILGCFHLGDTANRVAMNVLIPGSQSISMCILVGKHLEAESLGHIAAEIQFY